MMLKRRSRLMLALVLVAAAAPAVYAAANASRTKLTADKCRELCTRVSDLKAEIKTFLDYNGHQAIAWGDLEANDPGVDADGFVEGQDYTPLEVSNAIGGLDNIHTAMAAWMENLNKLASP